MDRFEKALVRRVAAGAALVGTAFVAGCASGGFGERPKLDNLTDKGPPRDEVTISFRISDADHTKSHVVVEYDDGGAWKPATLTDTTKGKISGNVVGGLRPTAAGITVEVKWDTWGTDRVQVDGPGDVTVRLSCFDVDGAGDEKTVSVAVDNLHPVLATTEGELVFPDGVRGLQNPTPQTFQVRNAGTGGGPLQWVITDISYAEPAFGGWLSEPVSAGPLAAGGTEAVTFQADCLTDDLDFGTYHATVTIEDNNAHESPAMVPVTLIVRNAKAAILIHDGADDQVGELSYAFDQVEPPPQTMYVKNSGETGTLLTWQLTDDLTSPDWLHFTPSSGQNLAPTGPDVPVTVSIVGPSGLASGEHVAHIIASGHESTTGEATSTGDQTVTVRLSVAIPPTIVYGPSSLTFEGVYKSADPDPQTLYISNSGVQTLNWTVTDDADWLTLSPSSDTCTSETDQVTLSVRITNPDLDAGTYSATITITDAGAQNSPQRVSVALVIYEF